MSLLLEQVPLFGWDGCFAEVMALAKSLLCREKKFLLDIQDLENHDLNLGNHPYPDSNPNSVRTNSEDGIKERLHYFAGLWHQKIQTLDKDDLAITTSLCGGRFVSIGQISPLASHAIAAGFWTSFGYRVHLMFHSQFDVQDEIPRLKAFYDLAQISCHVIGDEQSVESADISIGAAQAFLGESLKQSLQSSGPSTTTKVLAVLCGTEHFLGEDSMVPMSLTYPISDHPWLKIALLCCEIGGSSTVGLDYHLCPRGTWLHLTEDGYEKVTHYRASLPQIWKVRERCEDFLKPFFIARDLYQENVHYRIEQGRIVFLEHPEGMRMTSLSGILQCLEVLHQLPPSPPQIPLTRSAMAHYLLQYDRLCGSGENLEMVWMDLVRVFRTTPVKLELTKSEKNLDHGAFWRRAYEYFLKMRHRRRLFHFRQEQLRRDMNSPNISFAPALGHLRPFEI